jgi:hypothetical protein
MEERSHAKIAKHAKGKYGSAVLVFERSVI